MSGHTSGHPLRKKSSFTKKSSALLILLVCVCCLNWAMGSHFAFTAERGFGGGHGDGGDPIRKRGASVFPRYPNQGARVSGSTALRPRADNFGNRVTSDHMNRIDFANHRTEQVMKRDVRVNNAVRLSRQRFTSFYRPVFEHHAVEFNRYFVGYNAIVVGHPPFLAAWHRHYFFGGFYWGFHPIPDIGIYFYNPMVYWLYVGAADPYYYHNWYGSEYTAYPELSKPFSYPGLYYPTENLRQLLFGVSGMPVQKQAQFRTAISVFTKKVAQRMANGLNQRVNLSSGDVAVNHYEILGYDDAVVLEGVINFQGKVYNFKGLVNIENPGSSDVFIPATWDQNPTPEQLATLDGLNQRIDSIKGVQTNPSDFPPEPQQAPPPPNDLSAEPETSSGDHPADQGNSGGQ